MVLYSIDGLSAKSVYDDLVVYIHKFDTFAFANTWETNNENTQTIFISMFFYQVLNTLNMDELSQAWLYMYEGILQKM